MKTCYSPHNLHKFHLLQLTFTGTFRPIMTPASDSTTANPLTLLLRRQSVPSRLLGSPGPDETTLRHWLQAALRVPDHGRLTPWRYLLIRGDARHSLGRRLEASLRARDPYAGEAALSKERNRFASAPLVIAVIGRILQDHRIPACEQLLSAGCVCFSLLLAAQADGFGAQWLTGWAAYDREIGAALGLAEDETVVGFVHIGTPVERLDERERPVLDDYLSEWQG